MIDLHILWNMTPNNQTPFSTPNDLYENQTNNCRLLLVIIIVIIILIIFI